MISKYNGVCSYCKLPTKAGQDQYELATKTSYHTICAEGAESGEPGQDAYALADRLDYKQYTWDELQSRTVADGGSLRGLPDADRGADEQGTAGSEAPNRRAAGRLPSSDTIESITAVRGRQEY